MFGRLFKFVIIYAPIGLALIYITSLQENQDPWLIGVGIYLVIAIVIGNIYVLGGGRGRRK